MSFSDKIYALRNQSHLSQAELAERLKVSRQTISKWEIGSSYPEIDKLVAISNFFHVTTDFLLKDDAPSGSSANLDRLALEFLGSAQDMEKVSGELINIMRDGVIDANERRRMESIIDTLDSISQIIADIRRGIRQAL